MQYGWTFPQLMYHPGAGINVPGFAFAFDGMYVWAINKPTGNWWIFDYWNEDAEYGYLDSSFQKDRVVHPLFTVATGNFLKQGGYIHDATYDGGYIFTLEISSNVSYINKFDAASRTYVDTLTSPALTQGRLCVANGKCWVVSAGVDGADRQSLMFVPTTGGSWSSVPIPGKKQTRTRDIVNGLNGNVVLTCFNEHSICLFDSSTGSLIESIRVNRHPYKLHVNQRRSIYIASDPGQLGYSASGGGMISRLTQPTVGPSVLSNFAGIGGTLTALYDDNFINDDTSGYLWYVGGDATSGMARLNKSTKDFKCVNAGIAIGARMTFDQFGEGISGGQTHQSVEVVPPQQPGTWWITDGFMTPAFTYGSIDVKPHLFFTRNIPNVAPGQSYMYIYAARLSSLVRVNTVSVRGTAMISNDQQDYYGD